MSPSSSAAVIDWFNKHISNAVLGGIVYEMIGLNDAFGRVMLNNLLASKVF